MKILITGAAGYIGKMLVKDFVQNSKYNRVFAIDKKSKPKDLESFDIDYFKADLAEESLEDILSEVPDIIIHCAFDIRTLYGKLKQQIFNNFECCKKVFQYSLDKEVKTLIYLSSAAAYGAKAENIGKLLKETEPLSEKIYPYGNQKREIEEMLSQLFSEDQNTQVFVLRLSTVQGKEGDERKNLGLLRFVKNILPILPYTNKDWARQYINEVDLIESIKFLLAADIDKAIEIFNLAPNDFITMKDMAKLLNKRTIKIPVWFLRMSFFLAWHITHGYIPTIGGSYKSLIYPINLDGSKITKFGFQYQHSTKDTFLGL
ncbi:MAG: NAD-dependent epimerase/dehydratase family protein [Patescibacteria group bacterium]|nr:NAD-dependent epimerase/dehydratase family protein [Patescibacteria group bacterium]